MKFSISIIIYTLVLAFLYSPCIAQKEDLNLKSLDSLSDKALLEYKYLNLSHRQLNKLPGRFDRLEMLEVLVLESNNLTELPASVKDMSNIIAINLSNNPDLNIKKVVKQLSDLPNLKQLYISGCNIYSLPHEINNLTSLEILDLSSNFIEELPGWMTGLTKLKKLNLKDNELRVVSKSIKDLIKLEDLDISENEKLAHDPSFVNMYAQSMLKRLVVSDMNKVPESIEFLTSVEYLTIKASDLDDLPKEFASLKSLISLELRNISNIDLEKVFVRIEATKIKELILANVNATLIPNNISKVKSLEKLTIENSPVATLKVGVKKLKNLKLLKLKNIPVTQKEIFDQVHVMDKLEQLSLISMNLKGELDPVLLPDSLKKLDVSDNNITGFKANLNSKKNLSFIDLDNNYVQPEEVEEIKKEIPDAQITGKSRHLDLQPLKIRPPFANLVPQFENLVMNPKESKEIKLKIGEIKIPKNAFLDMEGKVVTENVDIEYKEFSNPLDAVLSGIPMDYDSGGTRMSFQSAGMIEFNASVKGEPVFPNEASPIEVKLLSTNTSATVNLYYFDTLQNNWINQGAESMQVGKSKANVRDSNITKVQTVVSEKQAPMPIFSRIRPIKPTYRTSEISINLIKPKNYRKGKDKLFVRITEAIDKRERKKNKDIYKAFPEAKLTSHRQWVIDIKHAPTNIYGIIDSVRNVISSLRKQLHYYSEWDLRNNTDSVLANYYNANGTHVVKGFEIIPDTESDNFVLNFYVKADTLRIPVLLDAGSRNPEKTQKRNKKFYDQYRKLKKERLVKWAKVDAFIEEKRVGYLVSLAKYSTAREKYLKEYDKWYAINLKEIQAKAALANTIQRSFHLSGFGVWNCDQINRMREPARLLAKLADRKTREELKVVSCVYVMDKKKNGVFSYYYSNGIKYDEESVNSLIAILPGDKIGIINETDFKRAKKDKRSAKLPLEVYDAKSISIKDLYSKLGI